MYLSEIIYIYNISAIVLLSSPGIGIMVLIIPYAFASVIKQLQREGEITRSVLHPVFMRGKLLGL